MEFAILAFEFLLIWLHHELVVGQEFDPRAQDLCRTFGYQAPHSLCLPNSPDFVQTESSPVPEILDLHNRWRVEVTDSLQPLANFTWDDELALLAERWAAQCPTDHDTSAGRTLPRFEWIGQNQCFSYSYQVTWAECVNAWAAEKEFWLYSVGSTNGSDVGHYTQLIWEDTLLVGCAVSSCNNSQWDYILVCNYGPGGNIGLAGNNHFARPYKKSQANLAPVSPSVAPSPPLTATPSLNVTGSGASKLNGTVSGGTSVPPLNGSTISPLTGPPVSSPILTNDTVTGSPTAVNVTEIVVSALPPVDATSPASTNITEVVISTLSAAVTNVTSPAVPTTVPPTPLPPVVV